MAKVKKKVGKKEKKVKKKAAGKTSLDTKTLVGIKNIQARKEREDREMTKKGISIERVPTGINGFDALVDGGLPKGSLVLLAGGSGTGKTTFGLEFLVQGVRRGEKGVYISLEESTEKVEKQLEIFGWPIERLEEERMLLIIKPGLYDFSKLKEIAQDTLVNFGAKRVVIDSVSLLDLYFKDDFTVRRALLELENMLHQIDCTTIIIAETSKREADGNFQFGVEEFISDGVIQLYLTPEKGEFRRGIAVKKMRLTNHSLKIHPIKIGLKGGIEVGNTKHF